MGAKESRIGFLSYDEAVKRGKRSRLAINHRLRLLLLLLSFSRLARDDNSQQRRYMRTSLNGRLSKRCRSLLRIYEVVCVLTCVAQGLRGRDEAQYC